MILHDVANRAGLVVEGAAPLHPEWLGHRDLHVLDELAVPDRLEEGVGEAEEDQVLHRLLPQIVIDPEDRSLVEAPMQNGVEASRRGEVGPEWLFEDQACTSIRAGASELADHHLEQRLRDGHVVQWMRGVAQLALYRVEGGVGGVLAFDVAHERHELWERHRIDSATMLGDAVASPRLELLQRPSLACNANHGDVEDAGLHHVLKGGKDLLEGEVTCRSVKNERPGPLLTHGFSPWA